MKAERFALIPTSHLIFVRNTTILLLRRFNTGYEDGAYSLPAGHLDGNETVREAAVREAREETGIEIRPENVRIVHVMHRKGTDERIDFFLQPKTWTGEPVNKEPHKCDDLRWFPLDRLPANTIPFVRQAIEYIQKNVFYSEFGWQR